MHFPPNVHLASKDANEACRVPGRSLLKACLSSGMPYHNRFRGQKRGLNSRMNSQRDHQRRWPASFQDQTRGLINERRDGPKKVMESATAELKATMRTR